MIQSWDHLEHNLQTMSRLVVAFCKPNGSAVKKCNIILTYLFTRLFTEKRNWFTQLEFKYFVAQRKPDSYVYKERWKILPITSRTLFKWKISSTDWTYWASKKCQSNNGIKSIEFLCASFKIFSHWWSVCVMCYFCASLAVRVWVWILGRQTSKLMTGQWCHLFGRPPFFSVEVWVLKHQQKLPTASINSVLLAIQNIYFWWSEICLRFWLSTPQYFKYFPESSHNLSRCKGFMQFYLIAQSCCKHTVPPYVKCVLLGLDLGLWQVPGINYTHCDVHLENRKISMQQ